jgi:hypothetical protein
MGVTTKDSETVRAPPRGRSGAKRTLEGQERRQRVKGGADRDGATTTSARKVNYPLFI